MKLPINTSGRMLGHVLTSPAKAKHFFLVFFLGVSPIPLVSRVGVVNTHMLLQLITLSQDQGFLAHFRSKVSGR